MRRALPVALGWCLLAGCVHDDRPATERGGAAIFDTARVIHAPPHDRCAGHGSSSVKGPCEDARYLAQTYVRDLSTNDEVCLEGGFGEAPGGACLARANVQDVKTGQLLLHIRDTKPNSRWYQFIGTEIWFDEGALVDLYLADRGY